MFCPKCKSEYREGIMQCADCGCSLVEKIESTDAMPEETVIEMMQPVRVFVSDDIIKRERIRLALEENDISNIILGEGMNEYFKIKGGLSQKEMGIYVDKNDIEKANEIISSLMGKNLDKSIFVHNEECKDVNEGDDYVRASSKRRWLARISGIIAILVIIISFLL